MEDEEGEKVSGCEVAELRLQVESLKEELKECKTELAKLQKQLSHSERLQRSTESYNEDLRKQVRPCQMQSRDIQFKRCQKSVVIDAEILYIFNFLFSWLYNPTSSLTGFCNTDYHSNVWTHLIPYQVCPNFLRVLYLSRWSLVYNRVLFPLQRLNLIFF